MTVHRGDPLQAGFLSQRENWQHHPEDARFTLSMRPESVHERYLTVRDSLRNCAGIPVKEFAVIAILENGEREVYSSTSLKPYQGRIFTDQVWREFRRGIQRADAEKPYPGSGHGHDGMFTSEFDVDSSYETLKNSSSGGSSSERSRRRQQRKSRSEDSDDGSMSSRRKRAMPSLYLYGHSDDTRVAKTLELSIGNEGEIEEYYLGRFKDMTQSACKIMGKAFVRLVEPKKRTLHPYTKGDERAPPWWPPTSGENSVRHKEPEHLLKPERIRLLIWILRMIVNPMERQHPAIRKLGLNVKKLEEATMEPMSNWFCDTEHPENEAKRPFLKEIFKVARMEERYKTGEIDGTVPIPVRYGEGFVVDGSDDEGDDGVKDEDEDLATNASTGMASPTMLQGQSDGESNSAFQTNNRTRPIPLRYASQPHMEKHQASFNDPACFSPGVGLGFQSPGPYEPIRRGFVSPVYQSSPPAVYGWSSQSGNMATNGPIASGYYTTSPQRRVGPSLGQYQLPPPKTFSNSAMESERKRFVLPLPQAVTKFTSPDADEVAKEGEGNLMDRPPGPETKQCTVVDHGDNNNETPTAPANDLQAPTLREIDPGKDETAEEEGYLMDLLVGLKTKQSTMEGDSKMNRTSNIAENDLSEPTSGIESGEEYSEEDEADLMKLLANVPVVIQVSGGEPQAINAVIDTGASSSFISKEIAHQYGLKERPLLPQNIKSFAAIADGEHTPKTFVTLHAKCSNIGLNRFVQTSVRVLNTNKFELIFGRPFIQKHGILHAILPISQSNSSANALFMIQEKRSDKAEPLVSNEDTLASLTTAAGPTLSVTPPSSTEIDPATGADAALSDLSTDSSEIESSSMEEESDFDEETITENDAQCSIIGMAHRALDVGENEEDLMSLMRQLRQAMLGKLMEEFWNLFNREWVENTRKCPDSPKSTTAPRYRSRGASATQESTNAKDKKRPRGNEDDENPGENNGAPPKRPRKNPVPTEVSDPSNNFACLYRKYDPRKYCAHSRKWRSCAMTPFADVSRVKFHLYRQHKIYQCPRCRNLFEKQEEVDEHLAAAMVCEPSRLEEAGGVQGVNSSIERRLRSRKKTDQTQSQDDRWKEIFGLLFGDKNVPRPYFEPVVEDLNAVGAVSSPDSHQLADFEEYAREELPRVFASNLQRAARNGTRIVEDILKRSLHGMIRDSQDQVFSSYRSRLALTVESPSADSHEAPHLMPLLGFRSAPPNFSAEPLSQERQIERLESFYTQPPHQIGSSQGVEVSAANFNTGNPEQNAFSDSGYQTYSGENGRAVEGAGIQFQSSSEPDTLNFGWSSMLHDSIEGENSISMAVGRGEIRASPLAATESLAMTDQEINQMITDPGTWDLLNADLGLDQVPGIGGQQDAD